MVTAIRLKDAAPKQSTLLDNIKKRELKHIDHLALAVQMITTIGRGQHQFVERYIECGGFIRIYAQDHYKFTGLHWYKEQ
jgi:hypothetical protein